MNPPLFHVGFEVLVERYMGVCEPGYTPPDTVRGIFPQVCRVEGIDLDVKVSEDWDEETDETVRVVDHSKGWRYFLVTTNGSVWGWEYESALIEKGYVPPANVNQQPAASAA
jgi:hypothetical protein